MCDKVVEETEPFMNSLVVNENTEDEFTIEGFVRSKLCTVIFYVLGLISAGLIFLLGYWYPVKRMKFTHQECSLKQASVLLIQENQGKEYFLSKVKTISLQQLKYDGWSKDFARFESNLLSEKCMKYFEHKFLRYYFNPQQNKVTELSGLDDMLQVKSIYEMSNGLTKGSNKLKSLIHGENWINVPVRSYLVILLQLAANPFYVFQLFSVILWYNDNYMYYASIIVFMTLLSLILNTYETRSHLMKLHEMAGKSVDVKILQSESHTSDVVTKSSLELVPGDVIVVPPNGMHLPCDAVLLNGRCVVNESTLTGESFPTTKTALDTLALSSSKGEVMNEIYSVNKHKRHTLYNGTDILQANFYGGDSRVLAVVVRTGFCTLKGRLIRSIIHPKPVHFTFFRDSMKFILFVFLLAFIGFIYTIVIFIQHGEPVGVIIKKGLDVFTIAVPPALPACMTVGLMYALYRLRKSSIFCIDPARVNVCGKVKLFVFDKTGTLTEDTLAVKGVVRVKDSQIFDMEEDVNSIQGEEILKGMACCHSITMMQDNCLTGDPLDMYMFEFTRWKLHEPKDESGSKFEMLAPVSVTPPVPDEKKTIDGSEEFEIGIFKHYPFESSLQRMSVISKELSAKHMTVYTKGSPEMILSLCSEETKPVGIHDVLMQYAKTGCRVLAVASKQLPLDIKWHHIKRLQRSEVESDLHFVGLIIFENVLKPVSKSIINALEDADIRTIMATGDNLYTAASVAREVNIVKNFQTLIKVDVDENNQLSFVKLQKASFSEMNCANSGESNITLDYKSLDYSLVLSGITYIKIKENYPEMLSKVLLSASVFARMSPDHKTLLVEDLKEIGYGVGMCGDGANDCGALKAAHAGIALSDTEASVASPFTSKVFDISCVPRLLLEGRAALVTSFGIFKYMALYSFIQFIGVLILYSIKSNYSDFEFLYADLVLNLPLCFTMIQSKASTRLTSIRPPGRLVHPIFIGSILLLVFVQFCFQFGVFLYSQNAPWYKPPSAFKENNEEELNFHAYENTSIMIISFFQYIWLSAVCGKSKPYRQPLYTNIPYVVVFCVTTAITTFITFYQPGFVRDVLLFVKLPSTLYAGSLFLLSLANFYISYVIEMFLMQSQFAKRLSHRIMGKTEPRNRYKRIYAGLENDPAWPPVLNNDHA